MDVKKLQPEEALAYLYRRPRFSHQGKAAYKPGLERVEALLQALGEPHRTFPSLHIAGTNGKGSTASLLAAVHQVLGQRTGLFTSPHLVDVTERIRINGEEVPWSWLGQAIEQYRAVFDREGSTFFEILTALAFRYFQEQGIDIAVVETGLGGRLDATNVLLPRMSLLTSIDYDHEYLLGETLACIAREKAGIIKRHVPVGTVLQAPEVMQVIKEVARQEKAPLLVADREVHVHVHRMELTGSLITLETPVRTYRRVWLSLPGEHQITNASLVVRVLERLYPAQPLLEEAMREGFGQVQVLTGMRGRMEVVQEKPLIVLDVAHNPGSFKRVLRLLRSHVQGTCYVLLGLMREKDALAIAEVLKQYACVALPVGMESERAYSQQELVVLFEKHGVAVRKVGSLEEGMDWFRKQAAVKDALLMAGSHLIVGRARKLLF